MQIQIDKLFRTKRKTMALIVERDGTLTVRAPMRVSRSQIESFVRERTAWVIRTRRKIKSVLEVESKRYVDGEKFLFLGTSHNLKLVGPQRPSLKLDGGFRLSVTAQKRGEQVFIRWYKTRASEIITERAAEFAGQYGFSPEQIRITSARTRWGSCSPNGTINFTWRLVMAPLDVIDYVVVHELAHLRVKNHSKKFWRVVESILPEYKDQRKWLRDHGEKLTL
jgi:predicted metal-dependent hydrolase